MPSTAAPPPARGQAVRVAHVLARANVGGPAVLVAQLLERLDPAIFDVRLFVGRVDPRQEADHFATRQLDLSRCEVPGLGRAVSGVGDARALWRLIAEFRRFRPHIVHTHTAKAGALGRLAARAAGVPWTVHTYHGHLLEGYFGAMGTWVVRRVEAALARRTSRLVTVGRRVRHELLAAGVGRPDQYTVIRPGVALPPLPPPQAARTGLGLPIDVPVAVFAGRLAAVKRLDRMLAACAAVDGVHLLVAGDGPLRRSLQEQASRLGVRAHFVGWQADMARVYAAADVAVLTSDNEGMPVFLIEAALAGLPAVTTDAGSAAEVVEHGVTGLVTPRDAGAVAAALGRLVASKPVRAQMGKSARSRARERFSVPRYLDASARLYGEVVGVQPGATVTGGGQ